MREKKYISWEEFIKLVKELASKIDTKFDTIICISRGGLVLGRLFSDILSLPLGVISAKCYENGKTNAKEAMFRPAIALFEPMGKRVLVVDDLVDTSKTIMKVLDYLTEEFPNAEIKTAVIYKDIQSDYIPDYFVGTKDKWIVFPYEEHEFEKK